MEAGGAISGSNFGLYYTVLMQLGYNYFGKIALKKIEAGVPLKDILLDIQRQMQPFNEQIMKIALDKLPSILEKTLELVPQLLETGAATAEHHIQTVGGNIDIVGIIKGLVQSGLAGPIPQAFASDGKTPVQQQQRQTISDYRAQNVGNLPVGSIEQIYGLVGPQKPKVPTVQSLAQREREAQAIQGVKTQLAIIENRVRDKQRIIDQMIAGGITGPTIDKQRKLRSRLNQDAVPIIQRLMKLRTAYHTKYGKWI